MGTGLVSVAAFSKACTSHRCYRRLWCSGFFLSCVWLVVLVVLDVGGYLCKVWYRGQPIVYDICGGRHVSHNCPLKGKCRVCNQEGHYARNCPSARGDAWGDVVDAPADLSSAAGGDGMDFELGSGSPPFDDQRDNQLDELQSGPRQSILANLVAAEPSVKDSDLNSVSGSESN